MFLLQLYTIVAGELAVGLVGCKNNRKGNDNSITIFPTFRDHNTRGEVAYCNAAVLDIVFSLVTYYYFDKFD